MSGFKKCRPSLPFRAPFSRIPSDSSSSDFGFSVRASGGGGGRGGDPSLIVAALKEKVQKAKQAWGGMQKRQKKSFRPVLLRQRHFQVGRTHTYVPWNSEMKNRLAKEKRAHVYCSVQLAPKKMLQVGNSFSKAISRSFTSPAAPMDIA